MVDQQKKCVWSPTKHFLCIWTEIQNALNASTCHRMWSNSLHIDISLCCIAYGILRPNKTELYLVESAST